MSKSGMNPKVDFYFIKNQPWQVELEKLRTIVLDCGLTEELKWGCPCYTLDKKNIVLLHVFKEYCAILFFKGVLLKDPEGILIQQTENVQTARQIRFTNDKEIETLKKHLKAYVQEAIAVENSGLKAPLKKTAEYTVPEEFETKISKLPALKKAFKALTPGRQRGYLLFFASAKQAQTRIARIEKCIPMIMEGKGLND